jgi:alpha-glucosidase
VAKVPLSFLDDGKAYTLTLWRDGDEAEWQQHPYAYEIETRTVRSGDTLVIPMASGGGFAAWLHPDKPEGN